MTNQWIGCACVALAVVFLGGANGGLSTARGAQEKNVIVEIVSNKSLGRVLEEHPDAIELVPTRKANDFSPGAQTKDIVTYSSGYHVAGDYSVAYDEQAHSWLVPQDIQMRITYPSSGLGAIVSYVEIVVNQSNSLGRAYVISGGIGQRHISIVVEAVNTYWFEYAVSIYGY